MQWLQIVVGKNTHKREISYEATSCLARGSRAMFECDWIICRHALNALRALFFY